MIFLKINHIKKTVIAALCLIICIASLCITAGLAGHYKALFFALPKDLSSPKIDVFSIDDFQKDGFPLTYEITGSERISLSRGTFPVTMIGTSAGFLQIMGLQILEGSFFSSQAWSGKLRHAVFNEKAAYSIFGSVNISGNLFKIRNDTWIVTGVINDGNEEQSRIYVPSSIQGGRADALAMKVSGTLDEIFILNHLKSLGVMDVNFSFLSMNRQIRLLWERVKVLLLGFLSLLLLSMLIPVFNLFKKSWKELKKEHDKSYITQIFKNNKKLIAVNVLPALGLVFLTVMTLIILINIASVCLPWQDIPSINRNHLAFFNPCLENIRNIEFVSRIIFIPAAAVTGFLFIFLNMMITDFLNNRNHKKAGC